MNKITDNKIVFIFSGYNQRAVFAFIRTLKKHEIDYFVFARDLSDPILDTSLVTDNFVVRKSRMLDLVEIITIIKRTLKKYSAHSGLIAPSTEALNRFMIGNKSYFDEIKCIIPLVNRKLYEDISDKYSFGQLCSTFDILIPKELNLKEGLSFPCVAKPRHYESKLNSYQLKPQLIFTKKDLEEFHRNYDYKDFYFQEYIGGQSFYLLYYIYQNGQIIKFSQENMVQQPKGESIVAAVSSKFHLSTESSKYEHLLQKQGFHGFVMIEVKKFNYKHYMIEANPRFWGPSQLFVDSKVNLFEAFLHEYGFIDDFIIHYPDYVQKYFWFGGVYKVISGDEKLTFYGVKELDFINNLHEWLENDVYKRSDSLKVFKNELICTK